MVFTDSTAAMARVVNDAPGPGQEIALRIISPAQEIFDHGNTITIRWAPAHRGVVGDEQADMRAREAAALPLPRNTIRHYSLAFLRGRATEQATNDWRNEIESRNAGRRTSRLPTATSRPGIRPQLRRATKRVAARFFQLLSGHATIAPFPKDRRGWTDSDMCWSCNKDRQSREHLCKECTASKNEIRELCTAVGEASGRRDETKDPFKSRKGGVCVSSFVLSSYLLARLGHGSCKF